MQENQEILIERYELTIERIASIIEEHTVPEPFDDFFRKTASFLFMIKEVSDEINSGNSENYSLVSLILDREFKYLTILAAIASNNRKLLSFMKSKQRFY